MSDKSTEPNDTLHARPTGLRGHIAGIVALVALAIAVGVWFWTTLQPAQMQSGIGAPHGIVVVGAGTFVAALIAEVRAMSLADVLEAAWELTVGLFSIIGAILKTIWDGFLSLLGWD